MSKEDTFTSMLGEFRGPSMGFFSRARKSGFPTPLEASTTPFKHTVQSTPNRPFDDTVLNQNDFIIRKKRRRSFDDSGASNESDFQNASTGTPWETKHLWNELSEARACIKSLEATISQLHGVRREAEVVFENEKGTLKASLERERCTVKELERRVKTLKRREENLREELDAALSKVNTERQEHELKAIDIHDENAVLKEKLIQMEKDKNDSDLKLKTVRMDSDKLENDLKLATEQLEIVNEQMAQLRKSIKDFETNKAALTNAQHKIQKLESDLISHNENVAVVALQQSKLMKYGELERQLRSLMSQNNKLRASTSNSFYLECVVEELRTKLQTMEERDKQLSQAKAEVGVLEARLEEFSKLSKEVAGVGSSADDLSAYIRRLQADSIVNSNQMSQLKSKVKSLEESGKTASAEIDRYKTEMASLKKDLEVANSNIKRLKKLNAFITLERNDLRSLVDSCQKEVTISSLSDPRIEVLEKLVENYRKKIRDIESNPSLLPDTSEPKANSAELENLKAENKILKEKVEKFEYELAHRALKGDFNNMNTKILHFKNNPLSEAIAKQENDVDVLRKENTQLKERLRLIKEGSADITQTVANIIDNDNSKEFQELKEKYKSQEIQNQRLKEAFKKSLQEFREAIFSLLGYKVDALPNKIFRLTSLYAEAQEHHLIFKMSSSGEMEMLETEFSKTLTELIELILIQHNSIPVFLSSLTMDLFKRQTHCVLDSTVQQSS